MCLLLVRYHLPFLASVVADVLCEGITLQHWREIQEGRRPPIAADPQAVIEAEYQRRRALGVI